jgi:hypothetical protein
MQSLCHYRINISLKLILMMQKDLIILSLAFKTIFETYVIYYKKKRYKNSN